MKVKLKSTQIKTILIRKNLSQNWLAKRIGTSTGYMSQLMNGSRSPSPKIREKIIKSLGITEFDDIFQIVQK